MNCKNCQKEFNVSQENISFYQKMQVSVPTNCPSCRFQRRLAVRNERTIYQRKCDLCQKPFISIYSPDKKLTVYCPKCWWSDSWDAFKYGRDYNFNKTFFQQYKELRDSTPLIGLTAVANDNSDFTNRSWYCKNCYLSFDVNTDENCMYVETCYYNKDLVDVSCTNNSELCYELLNCDHCFNTMYSIYAQDCYESKFLYDCRSTRHCFMCGNLNNAEFCYKNKQYSETEYNKIISQYDLGDYGQLQKARVEFQEFMKTIPRRTVMLKSENCRGENLTNCVNSHYSFGSAKLENCDYCIDSTGMKECYDCDYSGTGGANLCLEGIGYHDNYMCRSSDSNGKIKFSDYCTSCFNSNYLFGCVSVKKGEYCILNKPYSENDYNNLLVKIIAKMKADGEWGEFFPINISPFGYNETVAGELFPLAKDQIITKGYFWQEELDKKYQPQIYNVPSNIKNISVEIIKQILACKKCGKNYKIIPQELKFYQEQKIPVPLECPNCRHLTRISQRNPRQLWQRKCSKCGQNMISTYSPERPEILYCTDCYKKEVY